MRIDVSGKGLVLAVKKSRQKKKLLSLVYDSNSMGIPIRVGYVLVSENESSEGKSINWFNSDDIDVKIFPKDTSFLGAASLNVNYVHPKKNEKHFKVHLPLKSDFSLLFRVLLRTETNRENNFVIQVEIKGINSKKTKPIVRYDCAHGFIHRDLLYKDGRKIKKKLPTQVKTTAIEYALKEIVENLPNFLKECGYENVDTSSLENGIFILGLNKAKKQIIMLLNDPAKIPDSKSEILILAE